MYFIQANATLASAINLFLNGEGGSRKIAENFPKTLILSPKLSKAS